MFHWQIVPYLISFGISTSVAVFSWRRRNVKGALAYAWVAASHTSWTVGYIFELISPSLQAKIFWDDFQWLGAFGWMVAFLAFVYQFTETRIESPRRVWGIISAPAAVFILLVATNPLHGLVHSGEYLIPGRPWAVLDYKITTAVIIFSIYNYFIAIASLFLLVRKFTRTHLLFRAQIGIITIGTIIPLVGTLFPIFDIRLGLHRDITPLTFAISSLIVVYGLFRYRFLDIAPVAYRAVFDDLPDAVIVIDDQERVVDFNPAALKVFPGLTTAVIGKKAEEVFVAFPELIEQFEGKSEARTELRIGDGAQVIYQDVQISPLYRQDGMIIGRVMLFRDVTAQNHAKRALERSEEKYRRLVESTPDWVWAIDTEGNHTFSNSVVEKILGLSVEEIVGKSSFIFMHPDDQRMVQDMVARSGEHNQGWQNVNIRWIHKDGSVRYYESTARPLYADDGTFLGLSGIDRDVTARVLAEQAAARYAEDLKATNEELKAFSYSVSHDLRAPLRAITGFVEILHENYHQHLDEEGLDYLERVRNAGIKMNRLIEDLLRLSRVTSSSMERQQVDLSWLAADIIQSLHSLHPTRQVTADIAPGMYAMGDPGLLRVLFENLIGNAWKFTGKNDRAHIEVGMLEEGGEKIFFVRDNGVGFDMSRTERMFDPFHRLPSSMDFEGTGIGLATVQRIVRRHGGRVWFEAAVDQGATFYFTI